jgi:molybdate transport system substrate-binding protein
MTQPLRGISSMATRQVLAELAQLWSGLSGQAIEIESVGGVDAARRVAEGEPFDVVLLADDAIDRLVASGAADGTSKQAIVRSELAACVAARAPRPTLQTAADVQALVQQASGIGYSTGPSGTALLQRFEQWGLLEALKPKLQQAKPGVPVASMVSAGHVSVGFQQLSELMNVPGIALLDPLPEGVRVTTVFSGAVCARASQPGAAEQFLRFLASPATRDVKQRHGMAHA